MTITAQPSKAISAVRNPLGGTIVISGGLGGLGTAMASELVSSGARVVLTGRRSPAEAAADLEKLGTGDRAVYQQLDAADVAGTERLFAGIDDLTGVVANAAIYRGASFLDLEPDEFSDMLSVNLTGSLIFAQAAARRLVSTQTPGSIVLISSWAQDVPDYGSTSYCVSKSGLRMMARVMALELGQYGIRVNTMSPGIVDAGMAQRQIRTDAAYAERARRTVPLNRFQSAEDVAQATRFLLSDDASYITGTDLRADGGASLFRRDA